MQGSEIYKICEKMEKVSRRELQKFKTQHGYPLLQLPSSGNAKNAQPARASKRTQQKAPAGRDTGEMAGMGTTENNSGLVDDAAEMADVVTREQKLEFVAKIKKLSNHGLTQMVNKIKEVKAQTISELPEEKIQIRVDDFDKSEFEQINKFVESILFNELPSKRQKTE